MNKIIFFIKKFKHDENCGTAINIIAICTWRGTANNERIIKKILKIARIY